MLGLKIPQLIGLAAILALVVTIFTFGIKYGNLKVTNKTLKTENQELRGAIDSYAFLVEQCNARVEAAEQLGINWQTKYEEIMAQPAPEPEVVYETIYAEADAAIPPPEVPYTWECGQLAVYSQAYLKRALARARAAEGGSQ